MQAALRLRVAGALNLRIKDVHIEGRKLEVRSGKGDKDRVITLPSTLLPALMEQRARALRLHAAVLPALRPLPAPS